MSKEVFDYILKTIREKENNMLKNCEKTVKNIRNMLNNYVKENNIKSLIIGVSGGADSALCCALACTVCNDLNIQLIGLSLPILTNKKDEIKRAKLIGENFCSVFNEIDLSEEFKTELEYRSKIDHSILNDDVDTKIRVGNLKARSRMKELYDRAYKTKGLVLSTDNYTEYLLGFWTLHGDIGDLGMIQELWKTEIYMLLEYLRNDTITCPTISHSVALLECIQAIPTDGLGITNSDLDQLGETSYENIDNILINYLKNGENKNNTVIKRYRNTHFKRNNPYNFKRKHIV